MISVFDVANYFLALVEDKEDCGDSITNLKLQKLCYYAQGLYLAINNEPLFDKPIEAWQHGPVIPILYNKYKDIKGVLFVDNDFDFNNISKSIRSFLDEIYNVYGQFSAWKLRDMTHEESPWKDVYNNKEKHILISHESLKKYFITRIE